MRVSKVREIVKSRTDKEYRDRVTERQSRGWKVVSEKFFDGEQYPFQALMEITITPGKQDG